MDLMIIVNSLFEGDSWHSFHDAIYNATGISHEKEKLIELFLELPYSIQQTAFAWGLNDTVFNDDVHVYIILLSNR